MRDQLHASAALYPWERPCNHCTGGWVSRRAGLDRCGKSRSPTGIRSPDRQARNQSLYRPRYRAHDYRCAMIKIYLFPGKHNKIQSRYIEGATPYNSQSLLCTFLTTSRPKSYQSHKFFRCKRFFQNNIFYLFCPCFDLYVKSFVTS